MRGFRFVLHEPVFSQMKAAAERKGLSMSSWLRSAAIERVAGEYDTLEESLPDAPPKTRDRQIHLYLDPSLHEELRLMALEAGVTMSAYMRRAGELRLLAEQRRAESKA